MEVGKIVWADGIGAPELDRVESWRYPALLANMLIR